MKIIALFFLLTSVLFAQIKTPQPSPFAQIKQVVGITDIAVEYSRPGIKGRVIFGDLVPFGKVWRTGANNSTQISFSTDVMLEGQHVPAGKYSIFTIPKEKEWKIIINKKLDSRQQHVAEFDLLSFKVKPRLMPLPVERFTIEIADMTDDSAKLVLMWAQTKIVINISTDTDKMVMAEIARFLDADERTNANAWYSAARYYFENKKDLSDALNMVSTALEINEKPFWILRLKAQILAASGQYEEAIVFAKRSLVSAQKAGNSQFVKMNEASIAQWKSQ